jgi:hypothetical protein
MGTGKYNIYFRKTNFKNVTKLENQSPNVGIQISSNFFFPKFAIAFRINGDICKIIFPCNFYFFFILAKLRTKRKTPCSPKKKGGAKENGKLVSSAFVPVKYPQVHVRRNV